MKDYVLIDPRPKKPLHRLQDYRVETPSHYTTSLTTNPPLLLLDQNTCLSCNKP
jgi:hypothetical protein